MAETIFMFSGQGSQHFQMGRELFEKNETFRAWMMRLDDIVHDSSGKSVIESLYSGTHRRGDLFDRTLLTHPAIFMVEYSLAQTLLYAGVRPDMVLGASLGSFAAATIAGFIPVEDALAAVVGQAIAMEDSCKLGGMIAVFADPVLFAEDFLRSRSELAAINFSSHFIVSARGAELGAIEADLRQRNIAYHRLPVSLAFHSRWIDEAKAPFQSVMRPIRCRQGVLPLVCCGQVATLSDLPEEYFWNVVRRPIRFLETIARLEQERDRRYIDVGPSSTLATFMKYVMHPSSRSSVHSILTPYGCDQKNLTALLASARN